MNTPIRTSAPVRIAAPVLSRWAPVLLLLLGFQPVFAADVAAVPLDYAIVLRETQVFASLEVYAEIIETVQPKRFFPVLRLVEDQYGIIWAMVRLDEERVGYLTDIIAVRKSATELEGILAEVPVDEIDSWDQQMVNTIQNAELEVGMSRTQVLMAAGLPLGRRPIGTLEELRYARQTALMRAGAVVAITRVDRLPLDRSVVIDVRAQDPEFTAQGGDWQDLMVGDMTYRRESKGDGSAMIRINPPVAGRYRLSAQWSVNDGNSPDVRYRISSRRIELAVLRANHRLHDGRLVDLGEVELKTDDPLTIDVRSADGAPFCMGLLRIELHNEPVTVPGE